MIKQAFLNLKRYSSISMDLLILLILLLFFIGCSYLAKINLDIFETTLNGKVEIAVFLKDKTDFEYAANVIEDAFKQDISRMVYIDKGTALESLTSDANLKKEIAILDRNPLHDHFSLILYNPDKMWEISAQLEKFDFVFEVVKNENILKNLNMFLSYILKIYTVFIVFIAFIFIFLLRYSIKIYSHYRRKEFILWQYLGVKGSISISIIFIESILMGIFAAFIASIFLYFFFVIASRYLFNLIFLTPQFLLAMALLAIVLATTINLIVLLKSKNVQNII
ncbi:MAG: hypothetical protein GY817_01500 [bacterium]|nr:hypothetical protein [bacterium]